MFSGIINDLAKIAGINKQSEDWLVTFHCDLEMSLMSVGDSIACDGICLTVVSKTADSFSVEISAKTRQVSNVVNWQCGDQVNIEQSLKIGDRLHGHFVLGHVDQCVKICAIKDLGGSHLLSVEVPEVLKKFIVHKGSCALNGISLTVNESHGNNLSFNIIPHTWKSTNLSNMKVNNLVNIEVDYLAKIVLQANICE